MVDFRSLSPRRLLLADCPNCLELGFRSPFLDLSVVNPGLNQRYSIPFVKAKVRSSYCSLTYLSEEKKASLEFSPCFGNIPLTLTIRPLENLDCSICFLGTVPAFESVKSDLSVLAKFGSVNKKGKFAIIGRMESSILDAGLVISTTLRDLVSVPSPRVSGTFGTMGTHWGIDGRFQKQTKKLRLDYLFAHKNSILSVAGKWAPVERAMTVRVEVQLKGVELDLGMENSLRGQAWSVGGRIKVGNIGAEVRGQSAGKMLSIGISGPEWGNVELWGGADPSRGWGKPLFGAKVILDAHEAVPNK
jgi:hypothetical protein